MFGNADAVGRRFLWGDKLSYEIVGIVENGKYDSLTESPWAAMFFPLEQNPNSDNSLMVRSPLPSDEILPEVRRTLAQIDPSLPFVLHSWPEALAFVLFPARVATATLGVMGSLAAMLALTGVFGMAMYSVSKRMKEFGIRVALGSQAAQLMRSALGRPLVLLFAGSAAGLLLGVMASRLLAQIVYQATPRDPLVLAGCWVSWPPGFPPNAPCAFIPRACSEKNNQRLDGQSPANLAEADELAAGGTSVSVVPMWPRLDNAQSEGKPEVTESSWSRAQSRGR